MSEPGGVVVGEDGLARCPWGLSTPDYVAYHDREWGRPVHGDDALFERVCLEAFQSGLSWITILRRRETFRAAFKGFEIDAVAEFTDADRERLLADPKATGDDTARAVAHAVLALTATLHLHQPGGPIESKHQRDALTDLITRKDEETSST